MRRRRGCGLLPVPANERLRRKPVARSRETSGEEPARDRRQCAGEDLNHHGALTPQGPQPCASTNSATSARPPSIARTRGPPDARGMAAKHSSPPYETGRTRALVSVLSARYSANTRSLRSEPFEQGALL